MILGGYSGGYLSKVEMFNWQTGEQCLIGKQKCGLKNPKIIFLTFKFKQGANLKSKLRGVTYFQFKLCRGETCLENFMSPGNGVSYGSFLCQTETLNQKLVYFH